MGPCHRFPGGASPRATEPSLALLPSLATILAAALVAFCPTLSAAKASLKVVATTPDLASVAREIGGDLIDVKAIASGAQNLHTVAAKPSFMMIARKADLWLRIGLQLEAGYERPILRGSRNRKILFGQPGFLDCAEGIERLEVPGNLRERAGITLSNVHPDGNPHYWLDPYRVRIVARSIAARMKRLDPGNGQHYDRGLVGFLRAIDEKSFGAGLVKALGGDEAWRLEVAGELDGYLEEHPDAKLEGWLGRMRPLRGEKIVTYHLSWPYFAERFGLIIVAQVEPSPGIPPSPRHIRSVIDTMRAHDIKIILMAPFYSRDAPEKIAAEVGATVVEATLSVGGQRGVDDYFGLIENAVTRLLAATQ